MLGGQLVQTRDVVSETREQMSVMTDAQPSEQQWQELLFAWKVCRHVRSNAIVIARDGATIGIGAGQMSRVDAVRIAVEKAQAASRSCWPARRSPPTPSSRSPMARSWRSTRAWRRSSSRADRCATRMSSQPCRQAGVAMVATGVRHFRH